MRLAISGCIVAIIAATALAQNPGVPDSEIPPSNTIRISSPADGATLPFEKFTVTVESTWTDDAWVELKVNGELEGVPTRLEKLWGGSKTLNVNLPVSTTHLRLGDNEIIANAYYLDEFGHRHDDPPYADSTIHVTIMPKLDLDGREPDPLHPSQLQDVPEAADENPGVLLATGVTKLLVQNPGGDTGTFTLTWADPAANKKLRLNGHGVGHPTVTDVPCAGPWPKEFVVSRTGPWNLDDTVDVVLTCSGSTDSDTVKLVLLKVEIRNWNEGDPYTKLSICSVPKYKGVIAPSSEEDEGVYAWTTTPNTLATIDSLEADLQTPNVYAETSPGGFTLGVSFLHKEARIPRVDSKAIEIVVPTDEIETSAEFDTTGGGTAGEYGKFKMQIQPSDAYYGQTKVEEVITDFDSVNCNLPGEPPFTADWGRGYWGPSPGNRGRAGGKCNHRPRCCLRGRHESAWMWRLHGSSAPLADWIRRPQGPTECAR